ncbi:E3 ubiquitin-protein ligase listerin isoform X1 [Cynara cardunculus var. scolymus]|uniref:E3 ubiquitin-protein ligase listerin isoform X1 n=1 Tax=Cynara cardunculus var. scolymus TaxID=59895 RepID=UPI000D629A7B|nr:E3 ubiquitin-protein ligase listerin isoform X1 [Cynara cardunculus var. scolymus]
MGRQKGEAARSKARPSSSSLAASLLPSGATAVGFGGYVGTSRLDTSVPTTQDAASPFWDIDGELAQHLKRLSRKDPTTKLKALTILSTLLKQKSAKEVSPIIPQWAFEYKKLLLDYNREVRRASHDTMANLVSAVGRDLAPHLKSLMGPWWFSQFDAVNEVSQAAKRSFQAAFPAQDKRLDALMLCTDEVFMYLEENLKLTPQSLSDKAVALDELQEMHQQVISSSLLALATLLDVLTSEKHGPKNSSSELKHALKARSTAISHAEKLLSVHKCFLDFLKSQSSVTRSAAYSLVTSCVKNIPHALNEANIKTLTPAILGAFQETDPTCHSSMWEAILLFSRRFPESWTTLNVHKTLFNRFWNFLRNGCFGSQQVSYPALVLFLDCVPPKAITMDKFFLEFFQNLWAGKVHSQSSNADQLVFFQSYRECFLWALQNAKRYCDGVESINHFRRTIVDEVLLKLLWHDYLMVPSFVSNDRTVTGQLKSISASEVSIQPSEENMKKLDSKYPIGHVREFGKCITEILSGIFSLEPNLLSAFCLTFVENCLDAFQQTDNVESCENIEKIIGFLLLVDLHAVRKGDSWPLSYLVGPMLSKSFQLIQTIDSSNAVKFMVVVVFTFGPRKVVQEIVREQNEPICQSEEKNTDLSLKHFLQYFKEIIVPWCLQIGSCSTLARLDLLLALLDDECFSEQWDSVILHATVTYDSNNALILARLMEKTREEIIKRTVAGNLNHVQGAIPKHWHHELLDSTALLIARSLPPFGSSNAQFICAALGGIMEEDKICLVSEETSILIFEEIFQKLQAFMGNSNFIWVRDANALLNAEEHVAVQGCGSSTSVLEMATFALEVLNGSLFRLKTLTKSSGLLPGVLAALFVIDWEHRTSAVFYDGLDNEAYAKVMDRFSFCKYVHAFRCKMDDNFFRTLSLDCRRTLGSTLVQAVRCALFNEDKLDVDQVTSLGCFYVLDVLDSLCQGEVEEQTLLDELLKNGDSWPLWIMPDINGGQTSVTLEIEITSSKFYLQASVSHRMAAFVDKLISKLGIARIIAGSVLCKPSSTEEPAEEVMTSDSHYSRAWLAAEMLCTWKWQGGSALSSFLPSLIQYTRNQDSFPSDNLLDSVVEILLDGALVQGASSQMSLSIIYPPPYDELENVEQVFVRALVLVLDTLFKDSIWGRDKALGLFNLLVDRLFVGETINSNCLKILPLVMSVLIGPLSSQAGELANAKPESSEGNQIHDIIEGWLQRTLSFPPLNTWYSGEDMEDWFQLVLSCYPLRATKEMQQFRPQRCISHVEQGLLLELLRKQRLGSATSTTVNKLPLVQMLLSKLAVVVVGYCWIEFSQEDWEFILYKSRWYIESVVVLMEEVAESVNGSTSGIVENLQHTVSALDSSCLKLARNALIAFSMFCGFIGQQIVEKENDLNPLRPDKWDLIKDRILEGILRLFFSTGAAEAIAGSYSSMASSVIASSRFDDCYFWELVALSVIESSSHARERAIKSFEIWGLSKDAVSSLYAILFSSKPVPYLQYAAYVILSSEPVADSAFFTEDTSSSLDEDDKDPLDLSLGANKTQLREEISIFLEKSPFEILELDLVSPERVHVFLAWSLLISRVLSSPSSSPTREKLIQLVQHTSSSSILDCIFQHVPLELCSTSVKKKGCELPAGMLEVAAAATRAITDNSVVYAVESLWPLGPDSVACFAGAIYGLMLRTLPAYVRGWFNDIRDRATSSAIESFTRTWCSPPLITNELSQIKKANLSDENFSVSVSKSANEVVATYTKDETGMDLVIRLPASYSLRPVDVDCTRSLGISEVKQRKWLLSMMSFVRDQNGALAEAIRIWKSNFDKEFDGVEECPICYSVIHTANHSLPRLACRTCKHKFHSACLYKWFSTSHKSNCPLCQSPF